MRWNTSRPLQVLGHTYQGSSFHFVLTESQDNRINTYISDVVSPDYILKIISDAAYASNSTMFWYDSNRKCFTINLYTPTLKFTDELERFLLALVWKEKFYNRFKVPKCILQTKEASTLDIPDLLKGL